MGVWGIVAMQRLIMTLSPTQQAVGGSIKRSEGGKTSNDVCSITIL